MGLDGSSIIAVIQLVAYIPAIVMSFIVCSRHGFGKSSGWYYTFSLCLVRIIGSCCQLATIANPDDVGLIKASIILQHIGLTPLMLASLGMLSRLIDWINMQKANPSITVKHFRLIQLLVVLGAILSIAGGSSGDDPNAPSTETDVGVVMYIVTFVALCLLWLFSLSSKSLVPEPERIIYPCIGLALPFIAVRVLYQILNVFVHSGVFVRIGGPWAVQLFMATAEEFVVVAIYLFLGFRLDRLDESQQGPILSRPWKDRSGKEDRRRDRDDRRRRGSSSHKERSRRHSRSDGYDYERGQSTGEVPVGYPPQAAAGGGYYGRGQYSGPAEGYPLASR